MVTAFSIVYNGREVDDDGPAAARRKGDDPRERFLALCLPSVVLPARRLRMRRQGVADGPS
jgi:hypothetical protein